MIRYPKSPKISCHVLLVQVPPCAAYFILKPFQTKAQSSSKFVFLIIFDVVFTCIYHVVWPQRFVLRLNSLQKSLDYLFSQTLPSIRTSDSMEIICLLPECTENVNIVYNYLENGRPCDGCVCLCCANPRFQILSLQPWKAHRANSMRVQVCHKAEVDLSSSCSAADSHDGFPLDVIRFLPPSFNPKFFWFPKMNWSNQLVNSDSSWSKFHLNPFKSSLNPQNSL